MRYKVGGKEYNIPNEELEKLEKTLDIPRNEAIDIWLSDHDIIENEIVEDLTEKAKTVKRYEKADKERKKSTKERKVDEEKKAFLNGFRIFAEGKGGTVTNVKNEAEFSFTFGENSYTVKLVKHRQK